MQVFAVFTPIYKESFNNDYHIKKSEKWYFLNNCSATRMKREILNIVSEVMSLDASYTLELEFYM